MRILTFTTLFPNAADENHGIFVENRLRHLTTFSGITAEVIAPVPWYPFKSDIIGPYAHYARVPDVEHRYGLKISHPRYIVIPKVGMRITPWFLAQAGLRAIKSQGLKFDLIDAHYFYPDGVAATMIGRSLRKPVVITARGSDINIIGHHRAAQKKIILAGHAASALIAVSEALKKEMIVTGLPEEKITVLRNGVDPDVFCPANRDHARHKYGLTRKTLLSVGRLIEGKGHHLVIEALKKLPDYDLLIAGHGPWRAHLEALTSRHGVAHQVRFLGDVPHDEMPTLYEAVDILILASQREGWPNVLLEAMACGTPVIASAVGGVTEVLKEPDLNMVLARCGVEEIISSIQDFGQRLPMRSKVRNYARNFDWPATSAGQLSVFKSVIDQWGKDADRPAG